METTCLWIHQPNRSTGRILASPSIKTLPNRPPPSFPSAADEHGCGQKQSKALETKGEAKKEEQIGTAAAAAAIPNSASRHLRRIRRALYPATQRAGVWGRKRKETDLDKREGGRARGCSGRRLLVAAVARRGIVQRIRRRGALEREREEERPRMREEKGREIWAERTGGQSKCQLSVVMAIS